MGPRYLRLRQRHCAVRRPCGRWPGRLGVAWGARLDTGRSLRVSRQALPWPLPQGEPPLFSACPTPSRGAGHAENPPRLQPRPAACGVQPHLVVSRARAHYPGTANNWGYVSAVPSATQRDGQRPASPQSRTAACGYPATDGRQSLVSKSREYHVQVRLTFEVGEPSPLLPQSDT